MVALQIRDVSDEVRDALTARARANGQSLQAFLLGVVEREAGFARNLDLLADIASWTADADATADDVIDALDAARASRGPDAA